MTTAIIGVGNIGSPLSRHLVGGEEHDLDEARAAVAAGKVPA